MPRGTVRSVTGIVLAPSRRRSKRLAHRMRHRRSKSAQPFGVQDRKHVDRHTPTQTDRQTHRPTDRHKDLQTTPANFVGAKPQHKPSKLIIAYLNFIYSNVEIFLPPPLPPYVRQLLSQWGAKSAKFHKLSRCIIFMVLRSIVWDLRGFVAFLGRVESVHRYQRSGDEYRRITGVPHALLLC